MVIGAAVAALFFLVTTEVHAHARWRIDGTVPVPRSTADGLKTGPCGNVARSATPATFAPGQVIEVEWEETINHPGSYRIAFSPANDADFDSNVLYSVADTQGTETPMPHRYKATITLPLQSCEACTLQLIQYMTESMPPSLYYSCADIRLATAGGGTPPPPPPPTPAVPQDMKVFAAQLLDDFGAADTDVDGALSMAEVQVLYPGVTTAQFSTLDTSGNGLVTRRELDRYINPPTATTGATENKDELQSGAASTDGLWLVLLVLLWRRARYSARVTAS